MRMWFSKKRPASCVPPIARAPAPSCLCEDARPAQSGHREPGGLPECVSDRESCGRGAYARAGRRAMKYRRAVVTASICDAPCALRRSVSEARRWCGCDKPRPVVFMFAGGGAASTWPRICTRRARLPRRDGRVPEEPRTEGALRMEIAALSSTGRGGRCRGGSGATFGGPSSAVCHAIRPGTHVDGVGHQAVRIHRAQYGRVRRHTSPAC